MKGGDKTLATLFTWTASPAHLVSLWVIRNVNVFSQGSGSKYFKFRGPIVHVSITPLCHYHMKVVIDNEIFKWTSLGANKTLLARNTSWARFGPSPVLQKGFTSPSHYLRNTLLFSIQKRTQEPFSLDGDDTREILLIYLELVTHLPSDPWKVILQS